MAPKLKVRELIDLLQKCPQDAVISTWVENEGWYRWITDVSDGEGNDICDGWKQPLEDSCIVHLEQGESCDPCDL